MDCPKIIASNQKEISISIQRVKVPESAIIDDFMGYHYCKTIILSSTPGI